MYKNLVNNEIHYQPQLVSQISEPSTVGVFKKSPPSPKKLELRLPYLIRTICRDCFLPWQCFREAILSSGTTMMWRSTFCTSYTNEKITHGTWKWWFPRSESLGKTTWRTVHSVEGSIGPLHKTMNRSIDSVQYDNMINMQNGSNTIQYI